MLRNYYELSKPRLVFMNVISAAAGFVLGSSESFDLILFFLAMIGIALIMASGAVFNNYIDRDIDAKMERTKNRELVRGTIGERAALFYGGLLGVSGFLLLIFYTNLLAVVAAVLGVIFYLGFYTFLKRKTVHAALVGSVSGAVPPVFGYVAGSGVFDLGAIFLFLILVFWQMPHFYATAIFRLNDYMAADIPVFPVSQGIQRTKQHIIAYILGFLFLIFLLGYYGYVSALSTAIISLPSLLWFVFGIRGFASNDAKTWARKMFYISLVVLLVFCAMIVLDYGALRGISMI